MVVGGGSPSWLLGSPFVRVTTEAWEVIVEEGRVWPMLVRGE